MVHLGTTDVIDRPWTVTTFETRAGPINHCVLVVRNSGQNGDYLDSVCDFLGIGVEHATTGDDLRAILPTLKPIAVVADLDGEIQDGFHVMKLTAEYDRSTPLLLLTNNDPAMLGAVDAVQEVWALTRVATAAPSAGIGEFVDFLCHAARDAGKPRLMRV